MWRKKNRAPRKIKQVWRKKAPPPPPWTELPRDITANILQRLGAIDLLKSAQKVCTTWRSVCKDPSMWRTIDMSNLDGDMFYDLEKMCRQVVDRSQGQLIDINIKHFGTDELLEYIAQRSGQLRRLRLARCYGISGKGLSEAAKRFEFLEELHLFFTSIPSESIEEIGRSCPLLKSFTLTKRSRGQNSEDQEAFAVAKNMPELQHLRLFGNKMTNEGLQAILDGCPHLESLDLRHCFNLSLGGDLEQRCSQQIKNLRRPYDFTTDYEFDIEIDDDFYSFDDYPSGYSDVELMSNYDDYYLEYDDFARWDYEDSDYEEIFELL